MARKGCTKVIYKGTFISDRSLIPFPNEIPNNGSLWRGVAVNDIEGKNKKLCQSIRSMYVPQITQALNNNW